MNEEKYLCDRLEDQINWYGKKSTSNKRYYYSFKTSEVILAAIVPFLIALSEKDELPLKIVAGVLSVFVGIIASILIVFKFQEKWIQYRSTSENLKHEKYLFGTKSGIYASDPKFHVFVERIEFIISKENLDWTQIIISKENKSKS
jgi:hypothetical protein